MQTVNWAPFFSTNCFFLCQPGRTDKDKKYALTFIGKVFTSIYTRVRQVSVGTFIVGFLLPINKIKQKMHQIVVILLHLGGAKQVVACMGAFLQLRKTIR